MRKMQADDGLKTDGLEKDSPPFKEAERKQRVFKKFQEDLMKFKKEFEDTMPAIVDKQKMYIENAKKGTTTKPGQGNRNAAATGTLYFC